MLAACGAPSPDWNGTWKLNPSKCNFQGPVFTISISPDGEYRYDDQNSIVTFLCDGKDRPTKNGATRACVKGSATVLDMINKKNGLKTGGSHWELSDDGNVLTATRTDITPTGPVITKQTISTRISGSDGFAGQWRDTSYLTRHSQLTLKLDGRVLKIGYPDAGQYVDAPLDGSDAPVRGPSAPDGLTYSVRGGGQRKFLYTTRRSGKVLVQGSFQLSGDGGTVTEFWQDPEGTNAEGRFVYEKE
jgi:hypothetical protein